jgi:hypothetical protein
MVIRMEWRLWGYYEGSCLGCISMSVEFLSGERRGHLYILGVALGDNEDSVAGSLWRLSPVIPVSTS